MQRALLLPALTLALSCGAGNTELSESALRGQEIYRNGCTACHGGDPNVNGSMGPDIAGSSRELIEARVVQGKYPPGYTPKRSSGIMPPFPDLAENVDDLTAYLSEVVRP